MSGAGRPVFFAADDGDEGACTENDITDQMAGDDFINMQAFIS
jgi:hypothetical protein